MRFLILEITTLRSLPCQNQNPLLKVVILSDCNGSRLTECTVTTSDTCATRCNLVSLQECSTGWSWLSECMFTCEYITATDRVLILVGGSTEWQRGTIEWTCVWVAGDGGQLALTVAGAVCSQMGHINFLKVTTLLHLSIQEAQWQHSTHFLVEHFQSTD